MDQVNEGHRYDPLAVEDLMRDAGKKGAAASTGHVSTNQSLTTISCSKIPSLEN